MRTLLLVVWVGLLSGYPSAQAGIRREVVQYKQGSTALEGVLFYDDAMSTKRPGILVVHDWVGRGPFSESQAEKLAKMGYVAFAADIYGQGILAKDATEAAKFSGFYKSDRALMRARAKAGLDFLAKNARVDSSKLGAIGFCFGGTTVLELARSGAPLKATVSFHGGLDTPTPGDAKNILGKVLALHGGNDPLVSAQDTLAFQDEMRAAKVDWQFHAFGGALHGFMNPGSGNDPSKGVAYDARAARRAWQQMKLFFDEIFSL